MSSLSKKFGTLLLILLVWSSVSARRKPKAYIGLASWYGPRFQGHFTASGEVFDMYKLTAAHRTLPFGTRVRVINLRNGKSCTVRINDRGPADRHRIIDLSLEAARIIGMKPYSIQRVKLEVQP